ncbi:hypothetical protein [Umezawaea beigongshangensis]|uniref:hypothetical protein n=1 Tax=Umezawaea beigongshangensis TaxID=2780383 RepID=UPI0018F24FB0|nr:hypothetical protein [Umezawaea beigongshangensis]
MEAEDGRRGGSTVLTVALVTVGVLVLLGIAQAVAVGRVGIGDLAVELRDPAPAAAPRTTSPTTTGAAGGGQGPSSSPPVRTTTQSGSWKLQRGMLTLDVTSVESRGGRVAVAVTVTNASPGQMNLPLASVVATDSTGRTHAAGVRESTWPGTVVSGDTFSGTILLDGVFDPLATTFSLAFPVVSGQYAPPKGATVADLPVPSQLPAPPG